MNCPIRVTRGPFHPLSLMVSIVVEFSHFSLMIMEHYHMISNVTLEYLVRDISLTQ